MAKPATAYQVYRILTTIFEILLFFLNAAAEITTL